MQNCSQPIRVCELILCFMRETSEGFHRSYNIILKVFLRRLSSSQKEVVVVAGHWQPQPRSLSIQLDPEMRFWGGFFRRSPEGALKTGP